MINNEIESKETINDKTATTKKTKKMKQQQQNIQRSQMM